MPYDFNPLIDLYGQTVAQELPPEALSEAERLKQQQMERGLAPAAPGAANPLTYSGPVAGYSGPVRPSDAPMDDGRAPAIPVYNGSRLSPDSQSGMLRRIPIGNTDLGHVMDLLGATGSKDREVVGGILNNAQPGLVPTESKHVPSIAERAAGELTRRRSGSKGTADPMLAGLNEDELRVVMGVDAKTKPETAPKPPNGNVNKYLQDTYNAVYEKTPGAPAAKKKAALDAARAEAQRQGYDADLVEGIISDSVKAISRGATGGGATDRRVGVVDRNGNRGTIPASQLPQALKQGYKQVQ